MAEMPKRLYMYNALGANNTLFAILALNLLILTGTLEVLFIYLLLSE